MTTPALQGPRYSNISERTIVMRTQEYPIDKPRDEDKGRRATLLRDTVLTVQGRGRLSSAAEDANA